MTDLTKVFFSLSIYKFVSTKNLNPSMGDLRLDTLLVGRPDSLGDDSGRSALVHTVSEV